MVKPIFKKSRPDHFATLRKWRDGPDERPAFVQVAVEGKHTPHLLISEKKLAETAERLGVDETAEALHYATELFTPEFRPRGLAHGGEIASSPELDGELAQYGTNGDEVAKALHGLHGDEGSAPWDGAPWDGDEGADDRVVVFGNVGEMYSARERDRGRVVIHSMNELKDMKAGRGGERMPLNIARTITVRISDEPTEDEQDEASAFDKVARRYSPPRRTPARNRRHDD